MTRNVNVFALANLRAYPLIDLPIFVADSVPALCLTPLAMVRKLSLATIFAAATTLACLAADESPRATHALIAPVPVTGNIQWVYSYAEGQQLARKTGKPMFVVFRCER